MNVGELHGSVIHALDRPQSRIQGFGGMAEKKGDLRDFKKIASNEQRTIRLARRFDVDQELSDYIFTLPVMQRPSGPLISGLISEVRAPFPTMWVEFSAAGEGMQYSNIAIVTPNQDEQLRIAARQKVAALAEQYGLNEQQQEQAAWEALEQFRQQEDLFGDDDNRVVGCLVEDAITHLEFQFFTRNRFHWWGVQYHRDRESHWPGELIKNEETDQYPAMSNLVARRCYGMRDVAPSFDSVVRHTNPLLKAMYAPDDSVHLERELEMSDGVSTMQDLFFGRMTTFVCMLIQTLNYPWVSYDPVMVVSGKKSAMPTLKPHDSYYRAKIVLPKDHHEIREIHPSSEPQHAKRLHQVRGHWRVYRNKDGSFRKRVWVAQHTRGNVKLGVVLKDYQLTFEKDEK